MKLKLRPLGDRLLAKRLDEDKEQRSTGGIIIPDTAKEKPMEGEVRAVGRGRRLEDGTIQKLDIKIGDRILMSKYAGTEVKIEGVEYLILREDDVLGVIEK
jgi:chaperonin GroES